MIDTILYIPWNPKPYLFEIGSLKIHYYSLCWIAAFVIGWYLFDYMFKKDGVSKKLLDPLFLYVFLGAIIGARLGEYLFYDTSALWDRPLEVFLPIQYSPGNSTFFGLLKDYEFTGFSGLASHGATIGILITAYLFNKKYLKRNLFWLLDRLAISVPLGGAMVRIGNFINSEIVGKKTDVPWAVKFFQQSPSYGDLEPRHPAQLYEAIGYVILFFVMWYIYQKTDKKKYLGYFFGLFFTCLWSIRFFVEFFKENQGVEHVAETLNIGLNNGQILSIPFIIAGIFIMITSKNRIYNEKK